MHICNPWSSLILIKKYNIPYDVELWISDLEPEKEKLVWWEKNFFPIQFQSKLIDCLNEFFLLLWWWWWWWKLKMSCLHNIKFTSSSCKSSLGSLRLFWVQNKKKSKRTTNTTTTKTFQLSHHHHSGRMFSNQMLMFSFHHHHHIFCFILDDLIVYLFILFCFCFPFNIHNPLATHDNNDDDDDDGHYEW